MLKDDLQGQHGALEKVVEVEEKDAERDERFSAPEGGGGGEGRTVKEQGRQRRGGAEKRDGIAPVTACRARYRAALLRGPG